MANPFFQAMRGGIQRGQNPMQMLQQLKANPVQFMKGMGYDVPDNLANNPMGIVQYLAQSNQLNQQQMAQYQQMMAQQRGQKK